MVERDDDWQPILETVKDELHMDATEEGKALEYAPHERGIGVVFRLEISHMRANLIDCQAGDGCNGRRSAVEAHVSNALWDSSCVNLTDKSPGSAVTISFIPFLGYPSERAID